MVTRIFKDADADLRDLCDGPVAVLGYGNQGHAHALNLRDAGVRVVVGQRSGTPRHAQAVADGFDPMPLAEAVAAARLVILSLPDDAMAAIYARDVEPRLRAGQALGFVHGFNIHYRCITPRDDVDIIMVAPKGPGRLVRSRFAEGGGLAAWMAVHRDATGTARQTALAWARGIGCTRVGVIETTFAAETVTDLFGEQTVLCGGVVELMKSAFDTLVAGGYSEEAAYFECVHEVKQVVDLIYDSGLEFMRNRISSTARYGGLERGPQMVTDATRDAMRAALRDIESGEFAKRFIADTRAGGLNMAAMLKAEAAHPMNAARTRLFKALGLADAAATDSATPDAP
jgi:ketol-acid reductoisomerase